MLGRASHPCTNDAARIVSHRLPTGPLRAPVPFRQGAAKRLQAAEDQLDQVLEAALGDDFDALDDFDAMEEAVPPPRPAGEGWRCAGLGVPAVSPVHRLL